jgi:hypothetical protein
MIGTILLIVLQLHSLDAWSAILMDGSGSGKTQLYMPDNLPPISISNINYLLSHLTGQAAAMFKGHAYFIGGATTTAVTIFNPSINASMGGVPMNVARYYHAAIVVNDTIFVCGGNSNTSCEQYIPSAQKWNMITPLPVQTHRCPLVTLNNRVYSFGANIVCGPSPPPIYMFDGQNWAACSSFTGLPYNSHTGIALDADRALICGGQAYKNGSCQYVSDCFIYSASSDSWKQAASMAQIRYGHSMVMFEGKTCKNVI